MNIFLRYTLLSLFLVVGLLECIAQKDKPFDGMQNSPTQAVVEEYRIDSQTKVLKGIVKLTHFYDSNGNKIKSLTTNTDGTLSKVGWYYEYSNQKIRRTLLDTIGTIHISNTYTYDSIGNQLSGVYIFEGRKRTTDYTYNYKEKSARLIEKSEGRIEGVIGFSYNKDWKITTTRFYDKENLDLIKMEKHSYYDSQGNEIQTIQFIKGTKRQKIISTYNAQGDLKQKKLFNIKNRVERLGSTSNYKYLYDSYGNWTELKVFFNDQLIEMKKREIIY